MALVSSLIVVGMTWMLYLVSLMTPIPPEFELWYGYGLCAGAILSLLDVVFPFFPLEVYNGTRIWDFNKIIWAILSVLEITVFPLAFFFRL